MYAIEKKFSFSAAHILNGLCDDHPCGALHGHNYDLYIRIESKSLDGLGFIIDFNDLKKFKTKVIDHNFDHATIMTINYIIYLSEYIGRETSDVLFGKKYILPKQYDNTTVENMCHHIHDLLVKYFKKIKFKNYNKITIKMSETDSSFGEYTKSKDD